MDEVGRLPYVIVARCARFYDCLDLMATSTSSRPDVPTSTLPAPHPTHPVAQRPVPDAAPEFRWTSIPEAEAYRLQLAETEAFESLFYDEVVEAPTEIALDEVLPEDAEAVVWRVRVEAPQAPWSTAAHFSWGEPSTSQEAQFLVDAPPVSIYPIEDDVVDAEAPAFTWEAVPEASGYRLQVAHDEAFADPIVDLTVETTSLTIFNELPEERATLHWRVAALFPNDTEGPWSAPVRFATDPDAGADTDLAPEGDVPESTSDSSSAARSPVAAGPAQHSQTSSTMALAFIGILLVSFLVTILLIMMSG